MRRGKEKLLAGLLTVGMVVSSMFSSLTPVYAAEITETTETQVYEETDESVTQSVDETEAQNAEETESVESTEVSKEESDIESSESINHTPETESTESVERTEGGETETNADNKAPQAPAAMAEDSNQAEETAAETAAEVRCVVNINGANYDLTADSTFSDLVTSVGGASAVETVEFVSGTVTNEDLMSINKSYKNLTTLKVNLDGDLTFKDGATVTTELPGGILAGFSTSNTPVSLETIELNGFTAIGNESLKSLKSLSSISIPNVISVGTGVLRDCDALTTINLPVVQTIGSNAFRGSDKLTTINLGPVESIGSGAFGISNVVHVTIQGTTAPTVSGAIFGNAKAGSTVSVSSESFESYLPKLVLGEVYTQYDNNYKWNRLTVKAPGYMSINYTSPIDKSMNRLQVLKAGQSIGEKPFGVTKNGYKFDGIYTDASLTSPEGGLKAAYVPTEDTTLYYKWSTIKVYVADKEGNIVNTIDLPTDSYNMLNYTNLSGTIKYELYPALPEGAYQWNTAKDGSGKTILGDTKIYDDTTLYPIYEDIVNVTVKVNDGEAFGAPNLGLAIKKAGADNVTKLEVVSGKLSRDEYLWMNQEIMSNLETLIIAKGVESENKTVPSATAVSAKNLHHLEIHGVEVMESSAIMANNIQTLILPDVKKTGNNSWGDTTNATTFIETVDLSSIEELGPVSFSGQTKLPELNLPNLRVVGAGCFRNAGPVKIITNQVPKIEEEVTHNNTFEKGSTITVPAQVYDEYMKTHDSNFLDSEKFVQLVRGKALAVVTVKINDVQYDAASLEDAVTQSGETLSNVENIEFVSGTITAADLAYMKGSTKYLKNLKMNLSDTLKLTDADGAESTVLPASIFKNKGFLETVELGGFTEIKADAFNGCTSLTSVKMPNVEVIGVNAFYYTDNYETIVLPASLRKLDGSNFGTARNGRKTLKVTMEGMTPPEATGRIFVDAKDGTITVPEGALPNYLTKLDFSKYFMASGDTEWNGLPVVDPAYHYIHYKGVNSGDNKYAYVKNNESVTADRIPTFKNGDMELVGWNTEKDGTGKALDADTVMSDEWTADFIVYAQWAEPTVTILINGQSYSGLSLRGIVEKKGLNSQNIETIEYVSGVIVEDDFEYIKSDAKYLKTLKMNLKDGLTLEDGSTKLPNHALQNHARLETVELGGFTELGNLAFMGCTGLEAVSMPDMKVIGRDAFRWTDNYTEIYLPETLKTMENAGFGAAKYGRKTVYVYAAEGSHLVNAKGAFTGADKDSYVKVPEGSLSSYLPNLDLTRTHYYSGDLGWNGLSVIDLAYHLIRYEAEYQTEEGGTVWTDVQYAYVKDDDTVLEKRVSKGPSKGNLGKVIASWNTAEDGTGNSLDAQTVMADAQWPDDVTVYAQWAEQVTVTFDVDGTTTDVKVIKGEALGDKLPKEPSKEGFTFKGWNTKADGTGKTVTAETKADADMTVYAVFEEVIVPPVMDSVTAENGKVTIVLKDKPTKAPTLEDIQLQMNLNGTGDKDIKITGFTYDDDKTIVLTFDKVAQTDKAQKFTLTVTLDGKSVTTDEVNVDAKDLIRDFVVRLYTQLLGRKPDEAGLESWTEVLRSQKEQGAKVAQGFVESPEFKKRNLSDKEYISILYRTFLDREADAAGLAAWQKLLDDGLSRLYVFKGFAESDEFTEICNSYGIIRGNVILTAPMDQNENVTKFIARCYKFCLGRKGDEAGINGWCNQILTGKNTAKQAAYGFVFSDEFEKKNLSDEEFVKTMYRVFMNREADAAGLKGWVEVLKNGKSREHVFNGFADSNEFKEICESYGIK